MTIPTERNIDRSVLQFADEVKTSFLFLIALGFDCVRSEATYVRFVSPEVSINVYHGRRSYEIGLELESTRSATDSYSFSEILRFVDWKQAEQYRNYAARTIQDVAEGVRQLAELFRGCVDAGVLKNDQLFHRLRVQRKDFVSSYALDIELEQARRKSEVAWHKKDYAAVVKALGPFRNSLTVAEVSKLKFCEKQLAK